LLGAGVSLFLFFTSKQKLTYSLKQLENKSALIPLAIIGSGPAGLSAALYGVRQGIHTVLFEGPKPGGQLTETGLVENWPGVGREKGPVIMKNMCEYVGSLGAFLVPEVITSLDVSQWPYRIITDDGQEFYALSIIVATGSAPRVLHVPGEHEYWGKGVTTCALCDAPYYKNKDVVVVGGGDSACEQVLQLAPYARTITMLVRSEHVRASLTMQHQVRAVPKARVLFNKEVKQIQGDSTHTTAVLVFDKQTGTMAPIPAHGIFLAIGHEPRTALVAGKVALRPDGSIKLKSCTQETSVAGIFAAGDVEDMMYRQAGVAAGAGIKAAIDAVKFLYACGWTVLSAQRFDAQLYKPARVVRISDDQLAVKHLESLDAFKQYVLTAQKPVIIDFYAQHCPACMHMLPLYEMVARQFADKILFYKVDTVGVPELEAHLKVERIPCFIVFNKGVQVARYYSVMSKPEMLTFVQQFAV
jgi:thioredoxin reductase (NADPH)